jgi:alpha-amylase
MYLVKMYSAPSFANPNLNDVPGPATIDGKLLSTMKAGMHEMLTLRTSRLRLFILARLTAALLVAIAAMLSHAAPAAAVDESAPAFLQMFEARWDTIEDRMADIFQTGYGRMWLPPPQRADSGNHSVGYDVFDRFDLGRPRNETLYGTERGLKTLVQTAHRAGVLVNTDFVPNHNGFSDSSTLDNRGTPSNPADDVTFVQAGGYPGFAIKLAGDVDGDFHGAFEAGEERFRLSGLVDIAQEKNHRFIRHPVSPGNPQNIPAGTATIFGRPPTNVPSPTNARFYPDLHLGGIAAFDPRLNQNVTLYNFNAATPLAGDPTVENATGLLMRNARWMIQEIGVDGFRIDAGRHFPRWVLDYLDQAMFRAKQQTLLDGSPQHAFSFIETGYDGNLSFLQSFIRKDINNANLSQVGGNRDALDFNLFGALHGSLSGNGFQNNWHNVRSASIDLNDDGLRNGSQGVAFAQSHDELGPFLQNVAYAYILMMPGNALVYMNAKEFGEGRDFPRGGKVDALGGIHGDTITTLVDLRNSHGRGRFHERWIDEAFGDTNGDGQRSNVYIYERENSALVGLSSRLDAGYDERTHVQTGFAPGTVLVELTGNAAHSAVDPGGNIPEAIRVNGGGQVTIRIPRNASHGRGYVVYGVAPPQGTLSIGNVSQVLNGATPAAATNGTARLADIDVITANSFTVRLDTTPVTLPVPFGESTPYRDFDADGNNALLKIDGGIDLNNNPGVDHTAPGSAAYGFEEFTTFRRAGYIDDGAGGNTGTGNGRYVQTIDTTQLAEGRHYVTVRAFRRRGATSVPVFADFKRTIYIDRLRPEAAVESFESFASAPNNPNDRDMIVRSLDQTADNMHIFLDLPASVTDAQVFERAQLGQNDAASYDRDSFVLGFNNLATGNHVATVITFEATGNYNIQRFPGLFTDTNIGAGFGDLDSNGTFTVSDICGTNNNSAEDILYSQNTKFRAAFDVNGDGLGDNRDLFALGDELVAADANQAVLDSYSELLLDRGDLNSSGMTDAADIAALYANFGSSSWLRDLNVDGAVNVNDVTTMLTEIFRTKRGDFNLDGSVNAADYVVWRKSLGSIGALYTQGDADLDGDVDHIDYATWRSNFGFKRQPFLPVAARGAPATAIPEPMTLAWIAFALATSSLLRLTPHGRA